MLDGPYDEQWVHNSKHNRNQYILTHCSKTFLLWVVIDRKEIFNSKLYKNWKPTKGNSFIKRDLGDLIFSVDLSSRIIWTVRGKVCSMKREEIVRFSRKNLVLRL